jgi:cell division protein FtsQ
MTKQSMAYGFLRLFLLAAGGLAACGAFFLVSRHYSRWIDSSQSFQIRRIDVEGNDLVSEKDVLKLAAVRVKGNIWRIDLRGTEKRIEANPFVQNAVVARYFPDVLSIRIEEKKPIVLYNAGGRFFTIDSGGVLLPARAGKLYELPVVTSGSPGSLRLGHTVQEGSVVQCLNLVKQILAERPELYSEVSEITCGENGLVVYTRREGIPVRMGPDRFAQKIRVLEALLRQWETRSMDSKIDYVDLRFEGQVVLGMGA